MMPGTVVSRDLFSGARIDLRIYWGSVVIASQPIGSLKLESISSVLPGM